MKWIHILDEQPQDRSAIIQLDTPYGKFYSGDFNEYWPIGMRFYKEHLPWSEYIKWCEENDCSPNFWWMYAKDFPFPDQLERSKREGSKCFKCKLKLLKKSDAVPFNQSIDDKTFDGVSLNVCLGNCI